MTLSSLLLSLSPSVLPPFFPSPPVWPPPAPHPSASVSPFWPCGRASGPLPVRAPSLPQVSVCSPRVSGGLWGRRSPLRLRLQQSPSPQEGCFGKHPRAGGTAPGQARAPRAGEARRWPSAYADTHPAAPPHTRARTQSRTPGPGGQRPDRRRAHPGPATAGASAQPQTPALGPTPPATLRRANTPPAPVRARPAQPPPPAPKWPYLAALLPRSALLPLRLAPARPRGRCGGMGPARGGSALPRHGDTRGLGRGTSTTRHPPRSTYCLYAPPRFPAPRRIPPHLRLRPLRLTVLVDGTPPPSRETTPLS